MDDYVDFEIAKKLKEKGFNEYSGLSYAKVLFDDTEVGLLNDTEIYRETNEFYCYAPTIYQVMKWLREAKRIDSGAIWDNRDGKWVGYVSEMDIPDLAGQYVLHSTHDTYEAAALAGIEYVLDNLI